MTQEERREQEKKVLKYLETVRKWFLKNGFSLDGKMVNITVTDTQVGFYLTDFDGEERNVYYNASMFDHPDEKVFYSWNYSTNEAPYREEIKAGGKSERVR